MKPNMLAFCSLAALSTATSVGIAARSQAPPTVKVESGELQGTAEGATFSRAEMDALLALAGKGIGELVAAQRRVLAATLPVAA